MVSVSSGYHCSSWGQGISLASLLLGSRFHCEGHTHREIQQQCET